LRERRNDTVQKLHSRPEWERIQQKFFETGEAAPVLDGLTGLVEEMAVAAFRESLEPLAAGGLAMLAVGGFGRRELFPYSDVDVLILLERESLTLALKNPLAEFVRLLWDAGLRLSHSVRTVAECTEIHEGNIELSISLLDRRLLAGSAEVYAKLQAKLPAFLERQGRTLARHLGRLSRARHEKYQDTLYHLEPDVKETPGGLRDLHMIAWFAQLRKPDAEVAARLVEPALFLSSLRCFLHYRAGRDQNLLNFEAQEQITGQRYQQWREPADFMREYFRNARAIFTEGRRTLDLNERSESSLASQFRDWRSRLSNAEFTVSNERVYLRSPGQLATDPPIVLRLLEFVARHGVPLAADTERRLEGASATFAAYCAEPRPLWPALRSILALPHASVALRAMHDTGLVQAMFPEWKTIVCLVVPDYYHRYTVDEHTLVTIEKVSELAGSTEPAKRRFAEVFSEVEDLALLRFALLFHDAGKGANSGDHARLSVELAERAMQRIQMPSDEQSAVVFLIEHHLDLSAVMNSRDLYDSATAHMLVEKIGTAERLKLLTILTYADIAAVHPAAMTPWRLEQLWQTYRVTHQELLLQLETARIQDVPEDLPELAEFIKGFPVRYLRTHTPQEIRAHSELSELERTRGVAVALESTSGVYRATIVTRDRPALFAALAGAISSFGMDIVKAEAFSNAQGVALDTFLFSDPRRTLELNPPENERLQETIEQVALGRVSVEQLLRGRPAPPKQGKRSVPSRVHFDGTACDTATLVEIVTEDRPRLLYDLAAAFSEAGCNIDVVLIDTEGHKAIDVFYVATGGKKLSDEMQARLEDRLLTVC